MSKALQTYPTISKTVSKEVSIFEGLTKGQRDFLLYRIIGYDTAVALVTVNRKYHTLQEWGYDEKFKEVEKHVLSNRELYIADAYAEIALSTPLIVDKALFELALKALEWDTIPQLDKQYVMRALELLKKVSLPPPGSGTTVYEEMIKRIRRID